MTGVPLDYEIPRRPPPWPVRAWRAWRAYQEATGIRVVGLAVCGVAAVVVSWGNFRSEHWGTFLIVYGAAAIITAIAYATRGKLGIRRLSAPVRCATASIGLVSLLGLMEMRSCAHATYFCFGPDMHLLIAGEPCDRPTRHGVVPPLFRVVRFIDRVLD